MTGFCRSKACGVKSNRYSKYCLHCQFVKLIGGGRMGSASTFHLPFFDHVHIYQRVPFARVFVCSDRQDGLQIYIRTWTPAYEQDRFAF